jgi:ATP synthase protein I
MDGQPDPPGGPKEDDDGRSSFAASLHKVGPFLHMGWSIAISVSLGALLGYWLDNRFDTSPWLLIAGALLGITAGFVELIRTVQRLS